VSDGEKYFTLRVSRPKTSALSRNPYLCIVLVGGMGCLTSNDGRAYLRSAWGPYRAGVMWSAPSGTLLRSFPWEEEGEDQ